MQKVLGAVIVLSLIGLTQAITCYISNNGATKDGCKYCGFMNVTITNMPSDVTQVCLQTAQLNLPITSNPIFTDIDVCKADKDVGENKIGMEVDASICDLDKCNDRCYNSVSSLGISIFAIFLSIFIPLKLS